jgi:hypothetical protein
MSDSVKNQTLREVYYGENGFNSTANTYKDAHRINPSITYDYVKEWLGNQSIIQTRKKDSSFNSYVADHPLQQVAIDLADYSNPRNTTADIHIFFLLLIILVNGLSQYQLKQNKA